MNYNFSEITFPSRDGIHTIHAELYTPKTRSAKGIVQLAHGMIDHVGRYKHLAEYLTGEGYILAGNNHLGHGKSAGNSEDYGFFASEGGVVSSSLLHVSSSALLIYIRLQYQLQLSCNPS